MAYWNQIHEDIDEALPALLQAIMEHGENVGSRNGRVDELTHVGITLTKPWNREITLPGRKANLAAQIAETMWVLAGRNDIEWLSHYLPRAGDFSDNGDTWRAGYGPRLRAWKQRMMYDVDQLGYVVEELKADPLSRRAVISLWDPTVDTTPGSDIACNNWLNFSSRFGKLDLHVTTRSNDIMWGWSGINAFEWSALQEIVAGLLGMEIGALHFSITSLHLYERHSAKADRIVAASDNRTRPVYGTRSSFDFDGSLYDFDALVSDWFKAESLIRQGDPAAAKAVDSFPEPMLQSWLRVLEWWWSGDARHAPSNTRLAAAMGVALQPPNKPKPPQDVSPFLTYATRLHNEKHAAYGDSWKRRGEMLGIMANIARKVDRLGVSGAGDTAADTAIDLMIYLAKYQMWLVDEKLSADPEAANNLLREVERFMGTLSVDSRVEEKRLINSFDRLEKLVVTQSPRLHLVQAMLVDAYRLALQLWEAEQGDVDEYRGADAD